MSEVNHGQQISKLRSVMELIDKFEEEGQISKLTADIQEDKDQVASSTILNQQV